MGYTDELLRQSDAYYGNVWGGVTSAEEIAAGTLSDALATAEIRGDHAFLFSIQILATIAREIVLQGESVWRYRDGRLHWLMSHDYDIDDPSVLRYARSINWQTGRGMSALQCAPMLRKTLEGIEKQIKQESDAMAMYMSPVPQSGSVPIARQGEEQKKSALQLMWDQFKSLKVKQSVVEGEMAQGISNYVPAGNYEQKRWGIDTPQNVINLLEKVQVSVLTAMGVPGPIVFPADANSQRESWRIYISKTVESTAKIIRAESAKLGIDVKLTFPELKSSDIAARARAFVSLVKDGGMTTDQAAAVSGILSELPDDK